MDDELSSGIERAVFGAIGRDNINGWLGRHLRTRLDSDLSRIVSAPDVSPRSTARLRRLAHARYPCPEPLDGPATTDGLTAVIETLLTDGQPGNGHEPSTRQAMAHALFQTFRSVNDPG